MELSDKASLTTAQALKNLLDSLKTPVEIVVCPSFVELAGVAAVFKGSKKVAIGAQNVHWTLKGAWTGEVSINQIKPYASWCIVGHSERRSLVGETDEQVNVKVNLLLEEGITPIVCVGETAQERDTDQTVTRISSQVKSLLESINRAHISKLVIAYEPIWAIGTGETPEPSEAAATMLLIRKLVAEHFDHELAQRLRILYGGSVKPDMVQTFVDEPGVDGVLVGGASIHPLDFVQIIKQVQIN